MVNKILLQIVLGEFEQGKGAWNFLYTDIINFLWEKGFSGATVVRADEGLDENDDFRTMILEDVQFNNLPIMIEAIETEDKVQSILSELKAKIPHGEIATMGAFEILEEGLPVSDNNYLMLKIYIKEKSDWLGRSLYEQLLEILHQRELIWSTVTRGIEGFGKDHVIHKQSVFSFSSQVPVIIESVGKAEVIRKIIPKLQKMVQEGMVIAIPVQVILDR